MGDVGLWILGWVLDVDVGDVDGARTGCVGTREAGFGEEGGFERSRLMGGIWMVMFDRHDC